MSSYALKAIDPLSGPQTTLESLLVLTDQTLRYEEAKSQIEEAVLKQTGHAALLSPVQMVLSNRTPKLRLPPPSSLAYYDVEDAEQQDKQIVTTASPAQKTTQEQGEPSGRPPTFVQPTASTLSRSSRSGKGSKRRRKRGKGGAKARASSPSPPRSPSATSAFGVAKEEVSQILQSAESTSAKSRWGRALNHAKKEAATRIRSRQVLPEHREMATGLVTQGGRTLKLLLREPIIRRAAKKAGIDVADLKRLPFKHFRTEPNSPLLRDAKAQRLAFNLYEQGRIKKLSMILSEVSNIRREREEEEERKTEMKKRVVSAFWDIVEANRSHMSKAELATAKAQRVLINENAQIKERLRKAKNEANKFIEKRLAIQQKFARRAVAMKEIGRRKQIVIEKYREAAEHLDAIKAARIQHNIAVKEMRLQEKLRRDEAARQEKQRERKAKVEYRNKLRDRVMRRQERQRDHMREVLKAKHAGLDEIKERTIREMQARQAERSLLAREKVARVARQRKEQEYKHKQAAKKTMEWFKRIELMDEMKRAAQVERGAQQHAAIIRKHQFEKENPILRKITPGPGAYDTAGGAFAEPEPVKKTKGNGHRRSKSAGHPSTASLQQLSSPFGSKTSASLSALRESASMQLPASPHTDFGRLLDSSIAGESAAGAGMSQHGDGGHLSPSHGLAAHLNSKNIVEQYHHGRKPEEAPMGSLFTDSVASLPASNVATMSSTYSLPEGSTMHRSQSQPATGTVRRRGASRRGRRDSLDRLYTKPSTPYTAVRSVEALHNKDVSKLDEDAYVEEVALARATLRQERRAASKLGRTSFMDRLTRQASKLPGAGQYVLPETDKSPVAKWGTQNPKSDVEWQIHRAKQLPGPGEYSNVQLPRKGFSVRFGTHNPKSEFEWIEYRAKQIPGPADYSVSSVRKTRKLKQLARVVEQEA